MSRIPVVTARWDPEAQVWVATSEDIVGLVAEASSLDALAARVAAVASDLLDENAALIDPAIMGDVMDLHILAPYAVGEAAE